MYINICVCVFTSSFLPNPYLSLSLYMNAKTSCIQNIHTYTHIYTMYICIYVAMSRNPVPEDPHQQPSVSKVWNAGLVTYPLSRLVARLKMTENSNANGGFVATGAYLLHTLRDGYIASVGRGPGTNLWFRPAPKYVCMYVWCTYGCVPRPRNVPLLRALWSLFVGISGILASNWGVLVYHILLGPQHDIWMYFDH